MISGRREKKEERDMGEIQKYWNYLGINRVKEMTQVYVDKKPIHLFFFVYSSLAL